MFLITTADQRFWKTDEPILFLGEWCKIFSDKHIWEKLDYEVLPYHWDDRKRLSSDYLYLNQLYEEILVQVSNCLNRIHGENHTTRYWRIIVGPWLYIFIAILYDRYQSILSAELSGKATNTYIAKYKLGIWIPKDFEEFMKSIIGDDYNHYLYSRIIETTSKLPYEIKDNQKEQVSFAKHKINLKESLPSLKSILERIIKKSWKFVPDAFNKIVFVSPYFSPIELMKIQLTLRQVPYLCPPYCNTQDSKIDMERRRNIKIDVNIVDNEFVKILACMIPEQIPACHIESYSLIKENALKVYPSKPKIIFTANASYVNEGFKLWAALHAESGVKFLGTQHGGFYGIGLWTANEDHEYEIYDKYYSWGWKDASREKIKPLPATKLIKTLKIHLDKDGRILMGHMGMPRYAYNLLNMPIASTGYGIYLRETFRFIEHLREETQELLLVRFFPSDYGLCLKEQFACECPSIECYRGQESMLDQLKKSRLFVGTYNATTYLESFAANFPTVLYWNPDQWEIRASAQPYLDMLRSVGILHYTPESAAEKINAIYKDPLSWWNKPEIQEAKDQFCYRFARTSEHWFKEWKEEFLDWKRNV